MSQKDTYFPNKYRPQQFKDVVGQDLAVTAFKKVAASKGTNSRSFLVKGAWGCIPNDQLVYTNYGIVTMETCAKWASVGKIFYVSTDEGFKRVSAVHDCGKKLVQKVSLVSGRSFWCTPEHKVMVDIGDGNPIFVKAAELTPSMMCKVVFPSGTIKPRSISPVKALVSGDIAAYQECAIQYDLNKTIQGLSAMAVENCNHYTLLFDSKSIDTIQAILSALGKDYTIKGNYITWRGKRCPTHWVGYLETKDSRYAPCYDLTVEDVNRYCLNGVVVHNSGKCISGEQYIETLNGYVPIESFFNNLSTGYIETNGVLLNQENGDIVQASHLYSEDNVLLNHIYTECGELSGTNKHPIMACLHGTLSVRLYQVQGLNPGDYVVRTLVPSRIEGTPELVAGVRHIVEIAVKNNNPYNRSNKVNLCRILHSTFNTFSYVVYYFVDRGLKIEPTGEINIPNVGSEWFLLSKCFEYLHVPVTISNNNAVVTPEGVNVLYEEHHQWITVAGRQSYWKEVADFFSSHKYQYSNKVYISPRYISELKQEVYNHASLSSSVVDLVNSLESKILHNEEVCVKDLVTLSECCNHQSKFFKQFVDVFFDPITEMKQRVKKVYDVTVPSTHLFMSAGVVNHNTTMARIFGRALNCYNFDKLGDVCNECPACKEAMQKNSQLYLEFDSTTVGNVEGIESLKQMLSIVPNGRRLVVLDEVHACSRSALNSLLKMVEEGLPNTIWLFATTEDVLPTIKSRCIYLEVNTIPLEQVVKRCREIAEIEHINITDDQLRTLALKSQGHMRDALSILQLYQLVGPEALNSSYNLFKKFIITIFGSKSQEDPLAMIDQLLLYPIIDLKYSMGLLVRNILLGQPGTVYEKMKKAKVGTILFNFLFTPQVQEAIRSEMGMDAVIRTLYERAIQSKNR